MNLQITPIVSSTVLWSLLGSAIAYGQNPGATPIHLLRPPTPITKEMHNVATQGGTVQSGHVTSGQGAASPAANAPVATGWHYGHATNCAPFFDGVTTWVYLYTQEGETWFTSNSAFQHGMLTQCAQGNWVAFFVINTSGTFNEM